MKGNGKKIDACSRGVVGGKIGRTTGGFIVGTAGWNIPPSSKERFGDLGTHLQRYSQQFNGVEINSSFYRDHQPSTYARWAQSVPKNFSFSVKLSRRYTHEEKLSIDSQALQQTLSGISELGTKLGCLLIQLPPSLVFSAKLVGGFFEQLRSVYQGAAVIEPRHKSWATIAAVEIERRYAVERVHADPECIPDSPTLEGPSEAPEIVYYRLHGSPDIYRSSYSEEFLHLQEQIVRSQRFHSIVWCIFDNTTFGFATENSLRLRNLIEEGCG